MMQNTRVWALALILSLMLNAFAFGFLIRDQYNDRHRPAELEEAMLRMHAPKPDTRPDLTDIEPLLTKLRASDHPEFRPAVQKIHTARHAAQRALQAEPFDANALEQALADLRQAEQAAAERAHASISELAIELSPEERRQLGRLVRHRGGPGRRLHPDMRLVPPPHDGPSPPPPSR